MRGFHKLVMLGVLLVTLLLVIDSIDAGRKQGKKKEIETSTPCDQETSKCTNKNKITENIKLSKVKKCGSQRAGSLEENKYISKSSKFETKKTDIKKNIKYAAEDKVLTDNGHTKILKSFQKLKKYKAVEQDPIEKFESGKSKLKKSKGQFFGAESPDNIFQSIKKTIQRKVFDENENLEEVVREELNNLKTEENISGEETVNGSPKKRKYKLVEVVLQEDGQEEEGNETTLDQGLEDQEFFKVHSEEVTEKTKTTKNTRSLKNHKLSMKTNTFEEDQNEEAASEENCHKNTEETVEYEFIEDLYPEVDSYTAKYNDPNPSSCGQAQEDPNRQGPKKITFFVLEEEIDGQVKRRIVHKEDGVTMCELADLLKEKYGTGVPEE